ncbi:hypothetical protein CALCODRAFT_494929 [Calocera cornea HHB12733]|uniref:Uncharacterized protein n=1 Tax=Calocera cornea HHB12733 TaxID=1353952 RepID=A0A165GSZ0_9BASI|nr:hypothetical protein CALCODRAFT_494929 [Calocera cornea HHB12733]
MCPLLQWALVTTLLLLSAHSSDAPLYLDKAVPQPAATVQPCFPTAPEARSNADVPWIKCLRSDMPLPQTNAPNERVLSPLRTK